MIAKSKNTDLYTYIKHYYLLVFAFYVPNDKIDSMYFAAWLLFFIHMYIARLLFHEISHIFVS